ncbi:hypothetical protein DPX16_22809 [Anabarilius grahami]|uniref:Uncharacterized protein n=1 Tax=Anabarilius grahami TaxID=495550 RepID=A0A3N0ZAC8_ANAGA|nr:hypothetical protein DPX16_22809 [Anabarilius grahami]
MASASSWPPFIYPQKSSEHSRQLLRHKQMKERPDTLFAEQDHSVMTNLLFYTEHGSLWHTAFCQHFTFTKKRGICKGRQILAFEDAEKNDETRYLTLNLYQNGTVMVQGSESALKVFIEDFEHIKTLALSDEDDNKDMNTDASPGKSVQKVTVTSATVIPSPISRMKDNFSLLEVEVVELKELILSHLKDNNMEQLTIDIKNLRQEVEYLQRHREEMLKEFQQTKDELTEVKSTLRRQLTEVRIEMQEELSALKSALRTKDELINNLKEELNSVSAPKESSKPLMCPEMLTENPQPEQLPVEEESHCLTDPTSQIHRSTAEDPRETHALILTDSNGKYINEKLLFPNMRAKKIWCPNTRSAFQILSERNLDENYKHIIIHTGTNDLRAMKGHVAPVIRETAIRATQRFPEAKITLSTLLPRTDVPFHAIHGNNVELSRSCALIPNVHLAHHKDIRPHHMYDHVHLNKQGVNIFARVLKSTALGNTPRNNRNSNDKRRPQSPRTIRPPTEFRTATGPPSQHQSYTATRTIRPPAESRTTTRPPSQHKSYAAAVQQPQNPAAAELNQIRHLLNIICSRLRT